MLLSLWVMVEWWTDLDPEVYPLRAMLAPPAGLVYPRHYLVVLPAAGRARDPNECLSGGTFL